MTHVKLPSAGLVFPERNLTLRIPTHGSPGLQAAKQDE